MKVIGLTGGIGSGKTAVSDYLAEKGQTLIDADVIAREVVAPGSEGLRELAERFGAGVLAPGGGLDRKKLAALVFSDDGMRHELNRILHGRIKDRMRELTEDSRRAGAKAVFLVAPLLFEAGMDGGVDEVWLVDATRPCGPSGSAGATAWTKRQSCGGSRRRCRPGKKGGARMSS